MTVYSRSSCLTVAILLTSMISSSTSAKTNNAIITDQLIHTICSQTSNQSLCLRNLESLKGKSSRLNSLAAIGGDSMKAAQLQANKTAAMIWRRYTATTARKRETRSRYHKCFMLYSIEVTDQLTKAGKYMLAGDARSVKTCVSAAVSRVNSCEKELMRPPREQSGMILEADRMFKDLISIILAICNNVRK